MVLTGNKVQDLFKKAKKNKFALPAVNVIGSNSINATLETAAKLNSPVIIQFSNGGAIFNAGKSLSNENQIAAIKGAVSGAKHVRELSDLYGATVILHTDHASRNLLPWIDGLIEESEKNFKLETIELAFYGASIIHPKTLQPLQKKEIPLLVKSFNDPQSKGTVISKGINIEPLIPCYIFKENLILLKLSSLDFSFMVEDNIRDIFKELHYFKMKVDVIQNSAISFSVCFFDKYNKINDLIKNLEGKFKIDMHKDVSLFTIRHFNEKSIKKISNKRKLLLEQRTEKTVRLIFSN